MIDLTPLDNETRLLFRIPLKPLQGDRFQPTGFPNLGAATYQTSDGQKLLVESAQSMANRLEATCWNEAENKPVAVLDGISHVTVSRNETFLTDSMLEAHRLNSPYIEKSAGEFFAKELPEEIGVDKSQPVDRIRLVKALLKYDVGSLIHGVFLESMDGRLRVARSLSGFIEASNIQVASSGGVKNDRVQATKDDEKTSSEGFGNVPFARDEFTAESIDMHINLDLSQIRGYGLGKDAENLLILLSLYKLRKLLDGDLRLRTACDLEPVDGSNITATRPAGFTLPSLAELEAELPGAISKCKDKMVHMTVAFDDKLKKGKGNKDTSTSDDDDAAETKTDEE